MSRRLTDAASLASVFSLIYGLTENVICEVIAGRLERITAASLVRTIAELEQVTGVEPETVSWRGRIARWASASLCVAGRLRDTSEAMPESARQSIRTGLRPSTQSDHPTQASDLEALYERFVGELRFSARLSTSSIRGYRQTFAALRAHLPPLGAAQMSPQTMTEFFRRLDAHPRWRHGTQVRGIKSSTVATYRSKLNRFCQWLVRIGELKVNPFDQMEYPRVEYEDRQYLEKRAIEKIFATTAVGAPWRDTLLRRRNLAIFATLLYAGLRKGELLGLYAIDYSPNHLELRVRGETSKSRRQRVVPVNGALAIALEDYLDERRRRGLQCEKLFVSTRGDQPLTADGLLQLVKQVRRLSGVAFHLHQFRHTFAVDFLNRGGDVAKLKQLLGHRDIRMTSAYLRCLPTAAMRGDVENITLDTLL